MCWKYTFPVVTPNEFAWTSKEETKKKKNSPAICCWPLFNGIELIRCAVRGYVSVVQKFFPIHSDSCWCPMTRNELGHKMTATWLNGSRHIDTANYSFDFVPFVHWFLRNKLLAFYAQQNIRRDECEANRNNISDDSNHRESIFVWEHQN